ncbi:tail protein X [Actinobacillus equuli]|uniref:tail protein X n=1 Tax=Actinobacillus equuli TaxID=718 RepID=UPI00244148EE|nr:tail protein X [Actinobacillus equuli]WGE52372.1 tail protein X [Actinobacillus equuli subsp. haemolyticus]
MSNKVLQHIVKQGERWDSLAYHYYGDALEYGRIVDVNPQISFCEVLPVGVTVYIPVLDVKPTNNQDMPPWLRGTND